MAAGNGIRKWQTRVSKSVTTLLCQNGAAKGDDNMEKGFKVIPFIVIQHHKGAQCNSWLKNTLRERAT